MKIGASSAHLAIAAGMIRSTTNGDEDHPDQQPDGADVDALEDVAELDREHLGDVREVEVGDELRDQQEQEQQARQPGPRLGDRAEHVGAALDRPRAAAVGEAGGEEDRA